jgi:N4-gp56 family major capsid protein
VFADTTYTEASRQVNGDITSTPINVGSEQVTITIKEFAGPYDSVNNHVAPYGISAFDAQMAVIPLSRKVGAQLKRDMDKFIDSALVTLLNDGASTVRPTGFTADNDHATSSHGTMDFETLAKAERTLQDLHVPTFDNGQYACVLKPKQLEDLKSDPTFRSLSESNPPINPVLRKNYVGSVGGLDIFKSATLTTTANSSSVDIFTGHVFGPGVIGAGVGRLPRVVAHDDTNYRRFHKVIWTMDAGWTLLDNRFVASVKTA